MGRCRAAQDRIYDYLLQHADKIIIASAVLLILFIAFQTVMTIELIILKLHG